MAKTIGIILIFLCIGTVVFTMYVRETKPLAMYETRHIQIGNAPLAILIADTAEKRTQGLMNITTLAEDSGMLFIFPDLAVRTFWNKNTYIDLDILWIREGRVVGVSRLPAITKSGAIVTVSSPEPADRVVEVHVGWVERTGVGVGDALQ